MSDETGESRTMDAGRALDALIAERVMGLTVCDFLARDAAGTLPCNLYGTEHYHPNGVKAGPSLWYSTDIAAAWQVVEAMRARGVYLDVCARRDGFYATAGWAGDDGDDIWRETAPLAICRAALATLSTPTGPTR